MSNGGSKGHDEKASQTKEKPQTKESKKESK
jgi:hypothetical protein